MLYRLRVWLARKLDPTVYQSRAHLQQAVRFTNRKRKEHLDELTRLNDVITQLHMQPEEPKVVLLHRLTRPVFVDFKDKLNVSLFVTSQMSEQEVAWRSGVNYAIAVLEKLYVQES